MICGTGHVDGQEDAPMTDQTTDDEPLERPDEIDGPDDQRRDGRPEAAGTDDVGAGKPADETPTVAPEEQGGEPSTEHAPGSDL
jgi:hypothetical protein